MAQGKSEHSVKTTSGKRNGAWSLVGALACGLVAAPGSTAVPDLSAFDEARDRAIERSREAHAESDARLEALGDEARRLLLDPGRQAPAPQQRSASAPAPATAGTSSFVGPPVPVAIIVQELARQHPVDGARRQVPGPPEPGWHGPPRPPSPPETASQRVAVEPAAEPTLASVERTGPQDAASAANLLAAWAGDAVWAWRAWTAEASAAEGAQTSASEIAESPPPGTRESQDSEPVAEPRGQGPEAELAVMGPPTPSKIAPETARGASPTAIANPSPAAEELATTPPIPPKVARTRPDALPKKPTTTRVAKPTPKAIPPKARQAKLPAKPAVRKPSLPAKTKPSRKSVEKATQVAQPTRSQRPAHKPETQKPSTKRVAATKTTPPERSTKKTAKAKSARRKQPAERSTVATPAPRKPPAKEIARKSPPRNEASTRAATGALSQPAKRPTQQASGEFVPVAKRPAARPPSKRPSAGSTPLPPKASAKTPARPPELAIPVELRKTTPDRRTRKAETARAELPRQRSDTLEADPPLPQVASRGPSDRTDSLGSQAPYNKPVEGWRARARRQAQREIDRARRIQARLAGRPLPVRKVRRQEPAPAPVRLSAPSRTPEPAHLHDLYCDQDHDAEAPQLIEECDRDGCYVFEEICDATGCTHIEVGEIATF